MCGAKSSKRARNHKGRKEWRIQLWPKHFREQAERKMLKIRKDTDRPPILKTGVGEVGKQIKHVGLENMRQKRKERILCGVNTDTNTRQHSIGLWLCMCKKRLLRQANCSLPSFFPQTASARRTLTSMSHYH